MKNNKKTSSLSMTKKELKKYVTKENFNTLIAIQPIFFIKDLNECITCRMAAEYLNVSVNYVNDLVKKNLDSFKEYGLTIFNEELAEKLLDEKKIEYNKGFYNYIGSNISLKVNSSRLINKQCFLYLVLISNTKLSMKLREIALNPTPKNKKVNSINYTNNKNNITKTIGEQNKEIQRLKNILRESIPIQDIDNLMNMHA